MYKFGVLGVGKMGGAILGGIVNSRLYYKKDMLLSFRTIESSEPYKNKGFNVTTDPTVLFSNTRIILLAIKPQMFESVLGDSNKYDYTDKCIISIAAGIDIDYLENKFPNATIVRAMPNTPSIINYGVTTICSNKKNDLYNKALKILASIGSVYEIEEDEMNKTLPLNGSMPAYLMSFAKEFIKNGIDNGIDKELTKKLCVDTIISSAKLLEASDENIDILISNVCSRGGTTIAGLEKLYNAGFEQAIRECYKACYERANELNTK